MGHLPRNIPAMCSDRTRAWSAVRHDKKKKFAGKLSRLEANPRKPRKFSAVNDLHYTVLETHAVYCVLGIICENQLLWHHSS